MVVLMNTHNQCFQKNKENTVRPCKSQFYRMKLSFEGVGAELHRYVSMMQCVNIIPWLEYLPSVLFESRKSFSSSRES